MKGDDLKMCVRCDAELFFDFRKTVKKFLVIKEGLWKSCLLSKTPGGEKGCKEEENVYYTNVNLEHLPSLKKEGYDIHPLEENKESINGEYRGILSDAWDLDKDKEEVDVKVEVIRETRNGSLLTAPHLFLKISVIK